MGRMDTCFLTATAKCLPNGPSQSFDSGLQKMGQKPRHYPGADHISYALTNMNCSIGKSLPNMSVIPN